MTAPPLTSVLSVILPAGDDVCLLQACLWSGEPGRRAWREYGERVGNVREALQSAGAHCGRVLPLLGFALERNGVGVDGPLLASLRAARVREELRARTIQQICAALLEALAGAGIAVIVLKGVALTDDAYGGWALRHTHDVDLLLRAGDLSRAARLLTATGWHLAQGAPRTGGEMHVRLLHESGLPVQLHSELFPLQWYCRGPDAFWERSGERLVAGVRSRVPTPADMLLHVCGLAACTGGPRSLQWVCDAWLLLARHPDLDWHLLVEAGARYHLALPLWLTLRFLRAALEAKIPEDTLQRLGTIARASSTADLEAALHAARSGAHVGFRRLFQRAQTPGERARLIKWILLPSPALLRSLGRVQSGWDLPAYYATRPFRRLRRWRNGGRVLRPISPQVGAGGAVNERS